MFSFKPALAALAMVSAEPALAQASGEERRRRGEDVMRTLNQGQPQPALEGLRRDFPDLADAITDYALGDVWGRPGLDHRTRQLAAVSAFAALGNQPFLRVHAGYALNLGVSEAELKEIVHLTTVHAGFPRAIEAAQTLGALFAERRAAPGARP
ncbi:carboxymuconolactone decarboxylase family protein [Bosea sp. BK604]|uniref:carboxymuconolactone decarboxylase family protein n=1 Tax=Bosea sp. BK604 TaxID=2512180 RepID=UPI0010462D65|nr:carboxymuconolactone decarboxylase family protein [Bosea sp. BK604]